jgi:hypothetical protein
MMGSFAFVFPLVLAGMAIGVMLMAVLHRRSLRIRTREIEWKETAMEWLVDDAEDLQLHVWEQRERDSRA